MVVEIEVLLYSICIMSYANRGVLSGRAILFYSQVDLFVFLFFGQ